MEATSRRKTVLVMSRNMGTRKLYLLPQMCYVYDCGIYVSTRENIRAHWNFTTRIYGTSAFFCFAKIILLSFLDKYQNILAPVIMKHYKTRYGTQLVSKKIKRTTTIITFEKRNKNNFSLLLPANSV